MDYLQRIDDIKNVIKEYKHEHERLILKAQGDDRVKSRLKTHPGDGSTSKELISHHQDGSITRILNTDCIIMPTSRTTPSFQKLWPQALVVNRSTNCAEIGLIESHGSLWKLIPCGDKTIVGSRVILQSSEIGESVRYLSEDLDMVEMKVDAAVWNVRICHNYPLVDSEPGAGSGSSVAVSKGVAIGGEQQAAGGVDELPVEVQSGGRNLPRGIVVQLEHVQVDAANPGEAGGVGSSTLASRSVESDAPEEPLLLVCETSMKLRNYSELAFEHLPYPAAGRDQDSGGDRSGHHGGDRESASAHEAAAREAMAALANDTLNTSTPEGHPVYRTYQWEVMPDSWIGKELDFLEPYIH